MPSHSSGTDVDGAVERWAEGLDEEVGFWYRWLRDEGGPWPEDYQRRMDASAELQPHLRELIDARVGSEVRILDVGSGPLTAVGTQWPGREVSITAVDPLADRYGELFDKLGLTVPSRPIKGDAERLGELLPDNSFDLACAVNCLDHSYDPLRAIRAMIKAVKPGRYVVLDHVIDEGERMRYVGLHQWNFRADDGRFVIWRPGVKVDAHAQLLPDAELEIEPMADAWLRVILRRR